MTKLGGGLRGKSKDDNMTRRLDDNLSSADFSRTRQPRALAKSLKGVSEKLFFIFIGVAVLFCAVRLTLQNVFPGKIHGVLEPLLGKNTSVIEQVLTGASDDDKKEEQPVEDVDSTPVKPEPPPKPKHKRHGHHKH